MSEYIYFVSNPSMPGLIKIGKTKKLPSRRLKELNTTGVPTAFVLELSLKVPDCDTAERIAHRVLHKHRVSKGREFFSCTVKFAVDLVIPAIGDFEVHSFRQANRNIDIVGAEIARRKQEADRIAREEKESIERVVLERQQAIRDKKDRNKVEISRLMVEVENLKSKRNILGKEPDKRRNAFTANPVFFMAVFFVGNFFFASEL